MSSNNTSRSRRRISPTTQTPEDKCFGRLAKKLFDLHERDILRHSLCPGVRIVVLLCCLPVFQTNEFEVLEFYGDAYLYERVSFFLMTTRRFMSPHLMTTVRVSCIRFVFFSLLSNVCLGTLIWPLFLTPFVWVTSVLFLYNLSSLRRAW